MTTNFIGSVRTHNIIIDGSANLSDKLSVTAAGISASSKLTVSAGGAAITGAVGVTGTVTSSDKLTVSAGGAAITGAVDVNGALTVTGLLSTVDDASIGGTATVGDKLTVSAGGAEVSGGLKITSVRAFDTAKATAYESAFNAYDTAVTAAQASITEPVYVVDKLASAIAHLATARPLVASAATAPGNYPDYTSGSAAIGLAHTDVINAASQLPANQLLINATAAYTAYVTPAAAYAATINGSIPDVIDVLTVNSGGAAITGTMVASDKLTVSAGGAAIAGAVGVTGTVTASSKLTVSAGGAELGGCGPAVNVLTFKDSSANVVTLIVDPSATEGNPRVTWKLNGDVLVQW